MEISCQINLLIKQKCRQLYVTWPKNRKRTEKRVLHDKTAYKNVGKLFGNLCRS